MAADDLRGDGAAEGEAVENRGDVLGADRVVEARGGDAVRDHAAIRRASAASAEAAIVEDEDVEAGVEEMRDYVRADGEVAGVAVAEEATRFRMFRAAVPGVQLFAVRRVDPVLFDGALGDAVVGGIPGAQRRA